ncbi:MAG: hypothetical protein RIC55_36910 [Pirellulaceae bacterium]
MKRRILGWLVVASLLSNSACLAAEEQQTAPTAKAGRQLQVLQDFSSEELRSQSPISHHSWSADLKRRADEFSAIEVADIEGGRTCRIAVRDAFPWGARTSYRALTIGPDYLPPEADAVRLRIKVLRGAFHLTVGSPTVYFGHSDVQAKVVAVEAQAEPRWQTLEFSLADGLGRNFRRARFGRESPVIHYTRWIQEPLYLYVNQPSAGEFLLERVELIRQGKGRAFPHFAPEQIRRIATAADFDDAADMRQAFTFFQEPIDLSKPAHLARPTWRPFRLSLERNAEPAAEGGSLLIEHQGTEEVCFAGVMMEGESESNALYLRLKSDHAGDRPEVVLDFLLYLAPRAGGETTFPWQRFAAPPSWRKTPETAFTYYLSQEQTRGVDYAMYHVRRTVPNGQWATLVLPYADFVCAYGQGRCAPWFQRQSPLDGDQVIALGMLSPFGMRRAVTRTRIDDIALVRVPGETEALRSYWQNRPEPAR